MKKNVRIYVFEFWRKKQPRFILARLVIPTILGKRKVWCVAGNSNVHPVLGFCGFQWCGFHLYAFSKNSPNIQLMRFSLHKWRNSLTHAFFVTNDSSAADLVNVDFCQTSKNAGAKDQVYKVCDSKSEKSAPQAYIKGTPLCSCAFGWIVGFMNHGSGRSIFTDKHSFGNSVLSKNVHQWKYPHRHQQCRCHWCQYQLCLKSVKNNVNIHCK